jgi:regulator of RNase E activity RraA
MGGIIHQEIERASAETIARFQSLPTSIVSDAMNRMNAMRAAIKPLCLGMRCVGTAVTVQAMVGCNLLSHKAIYVAQPGDVIVFDARAHVDTSVWGYLQTRACLMRGLAGAVIDGSVRDSDEIRKSGFPVFCAGISPLGPHKGWGDSINIPIQCGGTRVAPGDIVIGDDDGVVVVPKEWAETVAQLAEERLKLEKTWFKRLESGEPTTAILDLDKLIETLGVQLV